MIELSFVFRILIADGQKEDFYATKRLVEEALKGNSQFIERAVNGEDALGKFKAARRGGNAFDLIVIEARMEKINGPEFLKRIRVNHWDKTPVLVLGRGETKMDFERIRMEVKEWSPAGVFEKKDIYGSGFSKPEEIERFKKLVMDVAVKKATETTRKSLPLKEGRNPSPNAKDIIKRQQLVKKPMTGKKTNRMSK